MVGVTSQQSMFIPPRHLIYFEVRAALLLIRIRRDF